MKTSEPETHNRTKVELKLLNDQRLEYTTIAHNRTKVELKSKTTGLSNRPDGSS